jgi:predicted negative regulator of RcsB-dependent stress response
MEVDMNSDRIEEIQKATAYPEWNECAHKSNQLQALIDEGIERVQELQAENNKLREALESLSTCSERAFCATADEWDCAWQLTNEALKGMGEDDE